MVDHNASDDSVPQTTKTESDSISSARGLAPQPSGQNTEKEGDAEGKGTDVEKSPEEDPYEVGWEEGDKDNPRSLSTIRKWLIIIVCAFSAICVTATSSIYTTIYGQMTVEFHTTDLIATLGLSFFLLGLGVGPMLLAPLSEFYGRRPVLLCSYVLFIIWIIPSAVAPNITTMLVARFFDGLAGSAFLSVSGGTVGDLFTRAELEAPMLMFSIAPFAGPTIGPLVGGFINDNIDWRWTFYVLLMWTGFMLISIIFLVPETYHPALLVKKAKKLRKETGDDRWRAPLEKSDKSVANTVLHSMTRPFQLLVLEPMVLNLCLLSSLILGILYLFFGAFPLVFRGNHGFTLSQSGMSYLGLFAGIMAAVFIDPIFHWNYGRLVREREAAGGEPGGTEPEFRLPPVIFGAILIPISLFWFGWTTFSSVHWIVPIIASAFFGIGTVFCFSGIFTFLADAYPLYVASALAVNTFTRCVFGAVFPLFGVQMYEKLGYQWATTLLAFLSLILMPFPYIFYKYGKKIRKRSRFAAK